MDRSGEGGRTSMPGRSGWVREPPAAREYAVEPVGVATQTPSAETVVRNISSQYISVVDNAAPVNQSPKKLRNVRTRGTWVRPSVDDNLVQYYE